MIKSRKLLIVCLILGLISMLFLGCSPGGTGQSSGDAQEELPFEKRAPLRAGVICPLTGSNAYTGGLIRTAATLAVKEINENGGIQGHPVELFVENDEFDTPKSVAAAQKLLVQNKVHFLNGPLQSSGVAAVQQLTEEMKVPHITSCGSARKLTEEPHEWFFRLTLADKYQTARLAEIAVKEMGLSKVAIVAEAGSHGEGTIQSWTDDLATYGLKPLIVERFEDSDVDFSSQLTKIKNANPDVLVLAPLQPQSGANLARQAKEIGLNCQIFTSSAVAGSEDFVALAGAAAEGIISPASFLASNPDPAVQVFVEGFNAISPDPPEGKEPAQTYDIFKIAFEYLNQKNEDGTYKFPLGFTEETLAQDRAMIKEAFTTVKGYRGATGIEVNFGPEPNPQDRDGIKSPLICQVVNGKWVPMD